MSSLELFRRFTVKPDQLIPDSQKVTGYIKEGLKQIEETPRNAIRYVTTSISPPDERVPYTPLQARYHLYGSAGLSKEERRRFEEEAIKMEELRSKEVDKTFLRKIIDGVYDCMGILQSPVEKKTKPGFLDKWFGFYRL